MDETAASDGSKKPTVEEQIARDGSRTAAAGRAAFSYATQELMPIESVMWKAVPVPGSDGTAFGFLMSAYNPDPVVRDYALYEPALAVTVDGASLRPLTHKSLPGPTESGQTDPICHYLSPAARALPPDQLDVLNQELELLSDQVAYLMGQSRPDASARQAVDRFDLLFRFLVPIQLFPYYERLSPSFFTWLSGVLGRGDKGQVLTPPQPRDDLTPRPNPFIEQYDALALRPTLPPCEIWRLSAGTLAAALRELGLQPAAHSPLARVPAADTTGEPQLSELVEGWPTREWRAALSTLCEPAWEIVQSTRAEGLDEQRRVYLGGQDEVIWVSHTAEWAQHVLTFPLTPHHLAFQAVATLQSYDVVAADPTEYEFSAPELAGVLALADLTVDSADRPAEFTLSAAERAWSRASEDGLRWSELGILAFSPLLPVERAALGAGLSALARRGFVEGDASRLEPGPSLRPLVESLSRPMACSTLHLNERRASGEVRGNGFAVVRTGDRLWLGELADEWQRDRSTGARARLFQVTGEQLISVLDAFLTGGQGTGGDSSAPAVPDTANDKQCPSCRSPVQGAHRFCGRCGHRFVGATP